MLRSYLAFLGCAEPDAILASEWAFYYRRGIHPSHTYISASEVDELEGLRKAGFCVAELETDDADIAWLIVRNSIDRGMPIPISVDPFYLTYWKFKNHLDHGVLVYGYENDSTAWVIDGWSAISYKGPVSLSELRKARTSSNTRDIYLPVSESEPRPLNNNYLSIDPPRTPQCLPLRKIDTYIEAAIQSGYKSSNEKGIAYGITGIREFASDLSDTAYQNTLSSTTLDKFWRMMGRVWTEKGLGVSLFRVAGELYQDHSIQRASSLAEMERRSWWIAANLCLKASLRFDHTLLSRLSERMTAIAVIEEQIYEELSKVTLSQPAK